jgi:plasmid maintenance system antidote protein VapI
MDTLMRMQSAYDIAQTREREGQIKVKRYVPKERHAHTPAQL